MTDFEIVDFVFFPSVFGTLPSLGRFRAILDKGTSAVSGGLWLSGASVNARASGVETFDVDAVGVDPSWCMKMPSAGGAEDDRRCITLYAEKPPGPAKCGVGA